MTYVHAAQEKKYKKCCLESAKYEKYTDDKQ